MCETNGGDSPFNHYHTIRNAAETKRKQLLAAIQPTGIQHHQNNK
jgi:hypothetical protein